MTGKPQMRLTEDLDGGHDELAGEKHAEADDEAGAACKCALEGVDERVREGRGDERAVSGHLEGLA